MTQDLIDVPVLVVGGGPVGQLTALQLAKNGTKCMLVERNPTTTKYPKMEYFNMRSMELFERMGLDQKIRDIGVPGHYDLSALFSTGLGDGGEAFSRWSIKSPDDKMAEMKVTNDGSTMSQPYLRCTQIRVEARLQTEVQNDPLIDVRWSTKFESLVEDEDSVISQLVDSDGKSMFIRSQYVVGCDGAGSRVRRQLKEISWDGQNMPVNVYLVYFRSKDLDTLHQQGRFWHVFFTNSCAAIAQDEEEPWLTHSIFPADYNTSNLDPEEMVQRALGGSVQPTSVKIDEIITTSNWRPGLFLANKFTSDSGRVFLAGDAAHQTIPTGGYGLNTGVGDAFDIGWKLASVLNGDGGCRLLDAYNVERRPVVERNMSIALSNWQTLTTMWKWIENNADLVAMQSPAGEDPRQRCDNFLQHHDQENRDFGIESDYRYNGSPIIVVDREVSEPAADRSRHVPSTWPGARAPVVTLQDGETKTHDVFGSGGEFTLFDFSHSANHIAAFEAEAHKQPTLLRTVHLPHEQHVRDIYERDAVLMRPDGHVAWRCNVAGDQCLDVAGVLSQVTGQVVVVNQEAGDTHTGEVLKESSEVVEAGSVPAIPSC